MPSRRPGRPAVATPAQRERAAKLAELGMSLRAIAADVFGDARYKDRVARILDRSPKTPPVERAPATTAAQCTAVFKAAGFGLSLRAIAQHAFGDPELKDRVARMLRAHPEEIELPDFGDEMRRAGEELAASLEGQI